MALFNNNKQQNSGGINSYSYTDNSTHNTVNNITFFPATKTKNSDNSEFLMLLGVPFGSVILIKYFQLGFTVLQKYTPVINLFIIIVSLSLSGYVFFKTKKFSVTFGCFSQSIFPIILQNKLTTNNEQLDFAFNLANSIPHSIPSLLTSEATTKALLLYFILYSSCFILLYISILSILISTIKHKSVVDFFALVIYGLVIAFLTYGSKLL